MNRLLVVGIYEMLLFSSGCISFPESVAGNSYYRYFCVQTIYFVGKLCSEQKHLSEFP